MGGYVLACRGVRVTPGEACDAVYVRTAARIPRPAKTYRRCCDPRDKYWNSLEVRVKFVVNLMEIILMALTAGAGAVAIFEILRRFEKPTTKGLGGPTSQRMQATHVEKDAPIVAEPRHVVSERY